MRYIILPFILALGLVELALRLTALGCLLVLTMLIGVFWYVSEKPADFKDLLTPVCFKLAERLVA